MVKQASKTKLQFKKNVKLYMGSGEEKFRIDDFQIEFINALKANKISNLNLKSEIIENETHRTIFGVGFTNGLRYVYAER